MSDTEYQSGGNIIVSTQNIGTGIALTATTGIQALTLQVKTFLSGAGASLSTSANNLVLSAIPDPSSNLYTLTEDFFGMSSANASTFANLSAWTVVDGLAAGHANIASSGHPGIGVVGTGTTATGKGYIQLGSSAAFPTDGVINNEYDIRLPSTSNALQRYTFRIGMCDSGSVSPPTNGFWYSYTDNQLNGDWAFVTSSAGFASSADSGINVVGNNWYHLNINTPFNFANVSYTILGTAGTSAISNLLPSSTIALAPFAHIVASCGTTDKVFHIDFLKCHQVFNVPR